MYVWPIDQRRSWMANGIFLVLAGLTLLLGDTLFGALRPEWVDGSEALIAFWSYSKVPSVLAFLWGSGLIAKSKGYSGWWGIITLPLLLVPGLILILLLQDKWDPVHQTWTEGPNEKLLDDDVVEYAWEMKQRLNRSWKAKLAVTVACYAIWIASYLTSGEVSGNSRDLFVLFGLLLAALGSFYALWAGKHLAQLKGYDPLWAGCGLFLMPLFMLVSLTREMNGVDAALAVGAACLGPIFLMVAPRIHDRRRHSPFHKDPSGFYLATVDADPYADPYSRR